MNQDKKPRPLQRKPTFLQKLRGKDGGKKEEPLRNAYFSNSLLLPRQSFWETIAFNSIAEIWTFVFRKLPLPEIFYNNNDFELIENLSDREEDSPENPDEHER